MHEFGVKWVSDISAMSIFLSWSRKRSSSLYYFIEVNELSLFSVSDYCWISYPTFQSSEKYDILASITKSLTCSHLRLCDNFLTSIFKLLYVSYNYYKKFLKFIKISICIYVVFLYLKLCKYLLVQKYIKTMIVCYIIIIIFMCVPTNKNLFS